MTLSEQHSALAQQPSGHWRTADFDSAAARAALRAAGCEAAAAGSAELHECEPGPAEALQQRAAVAGDMDTADAERARAEIMQRLEALAAHQQAAEPGGSGGGGSGGGGAVQLAFASVRPGHCSAWLVGLASKVVMCLRRELAAI